MKSKTLFSSSQVLFTLGLLFFFFTLLNGYLQNLVADYRADASLVLIGVVVEMALVFWIAWHLIAIQFDPLETAGFVLVTLGVWWYFVCAALPTLLPPTQSSDAVRVYQQVLFSYPEGKLVSWYPAGGTFVTATIARWIDWEPLRVLHPVAASFLALSAGAVYGMTCALLPPRHGSKIAALIAPTLLFVPWSYFAGTINWEQYFFAQVFAQYFILAALWYTMSYAQGFNGVFAALIGAALLGVVAAYPIFVALPLALFGLVVLARILAARWLKSPQCIEAAPESLTRPAVTTRIRHALITFALLIALMILAALALQRGGILELLTVDKAARGDVGAGGVTKASLDALGGPIFLALALGGAWFAWKQGAAGKTLLGLLLGWLGQLGALLTIQPFFQVSDYRIDKTFYILVFPLAMLATLPLARGLARAGAHIRMPPRALVVAFVAMAIGTDAAVFALRPPKVYSPLTESELRVAFWAKNFFNNTYQISYLDPEPISAYWLSIGIWGERISNEWFQWIPAGRKLGPATFDEWYLDGAWQDRILVRYIEEVPIKLRILYQWGESAILEKDLPPILDPKPPDRVEMNFDNTLTLLGFEIPKTVFAPGETITLTTHIQTLYPPPATIGWRVELADQAKQVVSRIEAEPFGGKYPLQRWPPGKYARTVWQLPLDQNITPGLYTLRMASFRRGDGELIDVLPMYTTALVNATSFAPITQIKIPVTRPSADELRAAKSLQAQVGDKIVLANYLLQADRASNRAQLILYWQCAAKSDSDYIVFVHLLDSTGAIIVQHDAPPRGGTYPTLIWDAGEIVKDEYTLAIPADARGPLSLAIGMYSALTQKRLPVGNRDHIVINLGF